jgi:hypothetical protein
MQTATNLAAGGSLLGALSCPRGPDFVRQGYLSLGFFASPSRALWGSIFPLFDAWYMGIRLELPFPTNPLRSGKVASADAGPIVAGRNPVESRASSSATARSSRGQTSKINEKLRSHFLRGKLCSNDASS